MWPDVNLCLLFLMLAFETEPLIGLGLTNSLDELAIKPQGYSCL